MTYADIFAEVVVDVVERERDNPALLELLGSIPEQFFVSPCPDKEICTVKYSNGGFQFVVGKKVLKQVTLDRFHPKDIPIKPGWTGDDGLLVLVLESPHEHEFDSDGNAIAPAQGQTGINLGRHLFARTSELRGLSSVASGRYRVILVNAVQYQCSLGLNTKAYRDVIFRETWERFGEKNFEARLKRYIKGTTNHIVINCCSLGESVLDEDENKPEPEPEPLRNMVACVIRRNVVSNRYFRLPHPSSDWFCRKKGKRKTA